MLKLDRTLVPAPTCLDDFNYLIHSWGDLRAPCKRQLRSALVQLQGGMVDGAEYGLRCAYCEGAIRSEGHIEHFRRKNPRHENGHPHLTFAWGNLFLACGAEQHCGHYKDRRSAPPYDPALLIKPDVDDAGEFFYFHSSGEVRPRQALNEHDRHRANETIRVFALDDRALAGARARAIKAYRDMNEADFADLIDWEPADREAYLLGEIEATQSAPYASTIKHFLQSTL